MARMQRAHRRNERNFVPFAPPCTDGATQIGDRAHYVGLSRHGWPLKMPLRRQALAVRRVIVKWGA
jgi:hypothetical protein